MRIKLQPQSGFSLIEVTIAMAVAVFALVPIFGLLPIGLNSNQACIEQTAAAGMATRLSADLRATSPGASLSPLYQIPFLPSGATATITHTTIFLKEDGTPTGSPDNDTTPGLNPRYRATVFITTPATGQRTATAVRVLLTWPALTDMTAGTLPCKFCGSFETTISLDRN